MGSALNSTDSARCIGLTHGIVDDFDHFITADRFTATASDGGGVTETDGAGGLVTIDTSDSTAGDNDETYLLTSNEIFLLAANKPISFETYIKYAEANTDDANVAVGVCDAVAADTILDDGAGMKATFDGAVIYKVDGGSVWRCMSSNGTTRTDSISTTTAGGSSYQKLVIKIDHYNTTNCTITYHVDGVQLEDSNGVLIEHKVLYASATEMNAFIGVKNGGANEETVVVDYISCLQKR